MDQYDGAWFAFDAVLSWINTQDTQLIDKAALYKAVMDMRPAQLDALDQRLLSRWKRLKKNKPL